jgi:hypothetical protein
MRRDAHCPWFGKRARHYFAGFFCTRGMIYTAFTEIRNETCARGLIHEKIGGRAMESREFRQHASECERLARESSDVLVRQYLSELAVVFRSQANTTEEREAQRVSTTSH